ncbi:unnamed protein product [Durusdinium trenchii]|uniref:Uncharacterized protein n=1 Tax=Durusdinium trenchii TaxID=1381693 RepID=A0ABP0PL59_9DINO
MAAACKLTMASTLDAGLPQLSLLVPLLALILSHDCLPCLASPRRGFSPQRSSEPLTRGARRALGEELLAVVSPLKAEENELELSVWYFGTMGAPKMTPTRSSDPLISQDEVT